MKKKTILLVALLALVVAACGGGDDAGATDGIVSIEDTDDSAGVDSVASLDGSNEGTSDPDSSENLSDEEQVLVFAQCLRDEGLDVEDPTVDADGNVDLRSIFRSAGAGDGGGPPEGFREAFDACGELVEDLALGPGGGDIDQTELEDNLLEFAQCMRDNGFDMPDPDFSASGGPGAVFGDIDRDDPAFQDAQEACSDILAGFGGPGGGGGRQGGADG